MFLKFKPVYGAIIFAPLVLGACGGVQTTQIHNEARICANASETILVREFYTDKRPGVPLPVPARSLELSETIIASALPADQTIGAVATVEGVRTVWESIETWGADTDVSLVFAVNGSHTFNFPSKVPMTQPDDGSGFQDIYADNGDGVHGHLLRSQVSYIYAAKLPGAQTNNEKTRTVGFYDAEGGLVLGVYASIADGKGDPRAIANFDNSWHAIAALPRACQRA